MNLFKENYKRLGHMLEYKQLSCFFFPPRVQACVLLSVHAYTSKQSVEYMFWGDGKNFCELVLLHDEDVGRCR